jgi:hypothetical protein
LNNVAIRSTIGTVRFSGAIKMRYILFTVLVLLSTVASWSTEKSINSRSRAKNSELYSNFKVPETPLSIKLMDSGSMDTLRYKNARGVFAVGITVYSTGFTSLMLSALFAFANDMIVWWVMTGIASTITLIGVPFFLAGMGMIVGNRKVRPRVPLVLSIPALLGGILLTPLSMFNFFSPLIFSLCFINGLTLFALGLGFLITAIRGMVTRKKQDVSLVDRRPESARYRGPGLELHLLSFGL